MKICLGVVPNEIMDALERVESLALLADAAVRHADGDERRDDHISERNVMSTERMST